MSHVGALRAGALNAEERVDVTAAELDVAVFGAPYIVIDQDNHGLATAATAAEARTLVDQLDAAVSIVGTARPGIEVIDIDPADTDAPAEAGEAAAEGLRDWLIGYGLPYQRRASGRPGGQHLLAAVPVELVNELADQVAAAAELHQVAITLRSPATLRLLSAPHRHGLPAPLLDGTLQPADVPAERLSPRRRTPGTGRVCKPGTTGTVRKPSPGGTASEREFGRTCAAIRQGLTFDQTWKRVGDCQVIARGQLHYRQYMWLPAVTIVAAENGLDESAAWELARDACATRARHLGRDGWRHRYWLPAVQQATQDRPRRRWITDPPAADAPSTRRPAEKSPDPSPTDRTAQLDRTRAALHSAAADLIAQYRPQRQQSIRAVLDALAEAFVTRDGSIDVRTLAERARVSKSVTIEVKKELTEHGVIAIAERYAGGADHCHRYVLGERAEQQLPQTETTRWYTPTPQPARSYGRANPTTQHRQHQRERHLWGLRCELQQATQASGEKWATSQHPAAKTARSLWAQRRRWESLTDEQQAERRQQRRTRLGNLDPGERRAWFDWLNTRDDLAAAAARVRRDTHTQPDLTRLAAAPITVHLGMRDRGWFDGRVVDRQQRLGLEFAAAVASSTAA